MCCFWPWPKCPIAPRSLTPSMLHIWQIPLPAAFVVFANGIVDAVNRHAVLILFLLDDEHADTMIDTNHMMLPMVKAGVRACFGVPVPIVLSQTGTWCVLQSRITILYERFAQRIFSQVASYGLLAIPLFILTGELMHEGGIPHHFINAARVFTAPWRRLTFSRICSHPPP